METFQHLPLDTRARQIRLLNIQPKIDRDIVECRIKVFDLDDPLTPDYRALSYMWGPPPARSTIVVNNKSFLVRENLYHFLYNFKARLVEYAGRRDFEEEVQWLWIDQICIDQSTTDERNHQVEMMSEIYRRASYVYVWLGASNETTERVVQAIKLNFRLHHHFKHRSHINADVKSSIEDVKIPPLSQHDLATFFGNPYWERLWIVQEIMLARYIRIFYGDTIVSWDELKRFCTSETRIHHFPENVTISKSLLWLASNAQTGRTFSLPYLIDTFGQNLCADPSDRVYALLGMVNPEERCEVDYRNSSYIMFSKALKKLLPAAPPSQPTLFKAVHEQDYKKPRDEVLRNATVDMINEARQETGLRLMEATVILAGQIGFDFRKLSKVLAYTLHKDLHAFAFAFAFDKMLYVYDKELKRRWARLAKLYSAPDTMRHVRLEKCERLASLYADIVDNAKYMVRLALGSSTEAFWSRSGENLSRNIDAILELCEQS